MIQGLILVLKHFLWTNYLSDLHLCLHRILSTRVKPCIGGIWMVYTLLTVKWNRGKMDLFTDCQNRQLYCESQQIMMKEYVDLLWILHVGAWGFMVNLATNWSSLHMKIFTKSHVQNMSMNSRHFSAQCSLELQIHAIGLSDFYPSRTIVFGVYFQENFWHHLICISPTLAPLRIRLREK